MSEQVNKKVAVRCEDAKVIQGLVHGVDKFRLRGDEQQARGLVDAIHEAFFPSIDWGSKPQPQPGT